MGLLRFNVYIKTIQETYIYGYVQMQDIICYLYDKILTNKNFKYKVIYEICIRKYNLGVFLATKIQYSVDCIN